MSLTLHPYPAYKTSDVQWLGNVPTSWEVRRLKQACRLAYGDSLSTENRLPGDVPVYGSNGQVGVHSSANTLAPCIIIGRKGSYGKVTFVDSTAFAIDTTFFIDRRNTSADLRWLSYALSLLGLDRYSHDSAVPGLNRNDAYEMSIPLPPLPEQQAIVRYLDHLDERIRRLVDAKRQLISLLEEERQAVINQAVTRGLDPNVPLKPSGVEWLGDVPEHWESIRIRYLLEEVDNRSTSGKETHLSMSQTLGLVPSHLVEQSLISDSYVGGKLCQEGDLVLNRLKAHLGVFALAKQAGVISPDYSVFRKRDSAKIEYFFSALRLPTLRTELRIRARGIVEGFWRLYTDDFFDIRLPVPPYAEQQAIVEYVDNTTIDAQAHINRARRQIELLEEYRTRLIADVVTGKVDVRDVADQLSEEPAGKDA